MKITFLGAAGEVTGSSHLVDSGRYRFLVDCGMFQGGRDAYVRNLSALDFNLRRLDFVLLTHAHIDHSGLLPRLTALGYRGPVFVTAATADLLKVMLLDSAHIQEKEAELETRRRRERRARASAERAPLYTVAQAQAVLRQLRRVEYGEAFEPAHGVSVVMRDAGHILGSAIIEADVTREDTVTRLVFSGDLGMPGRPVVCDPTPVVRADLLVMESTYGDRVHKDLTQTEDELADVIQSTFRQGGNVIIPAFAVGRTQEIIALLADLTRRGRLSGIKAYVDSPMALAATEITYRHIDLLDRETRELIAWQRENPQGMEVRFIESVDESIALNDVARGALIISASGMCDAGRIKYHLANNLPRRECAVVITGFQAQGTLGRRLVDGAARVVIHGQAVPVRAGIHTIGGLSAHADRDNLLDWLRHFRRAPRRTCVVHGEHDTALGFAETIRRELGWTDVAVPQRGQSFDC